MKTLFICLGTFCVCGNLWSSEPPGDDAAISESLAEVLAEEAGGGAIDRRAKMHGKVGLSAADHWHVGELLVDGVWISVEEISEQTESQEFKDYKTRRGETALTELRHRELARWCRYNKLAEQERAHWNSVLITSPNDIEARQSLGHVFIAERWYTPEDLQSADAAARRLEAEWTEWMPKMRTLVSQITAPNLKTKQQGLDALAALSDRSAISSLEVTALQLSADHALPFIRAIITQRSTEACLALARISLSYPTDKRGQLAIEALRSYPKEAYVPELLGLLSTPIETKAEYAFTPKGELFVHRAMFRETQGERQLLRLNRLVQTSASRNVRSDFDIEFSVNQNYIKFVPTFHRGGAYNVGGNYETFEDERAGAKNAAEDQRQLEEDVAATNRQLERIAHTVYLVLELCTGEELDKKPEAWWEWWRLHNERYAPRKPLRDYQYSQVDHARVYKTVSAFNVTQLSCLEGRTQVQTAEGMKAIDEIQIGDMVLAQDVETGELALKPVLQTTIRPPSIMWNIVTDSGEITATAGHRWFVSGRGWLMTRELENGMLLHNATGTTRIKRLTLHNTEKKAFNLIVADFNTYFVGPERVLSFDNSNPIATMSVVPGFKTASPN